MKKAKELERENIFVRKYGDFIKLSTKLKPIDIDDEETTRYLESVGNGKKIVKDFKLIKEMLKTGFVLNQKFIYKGRTFKDILKMLDRINHALETGVKED